MLCFTLYRSTKLISQMRKKRYPNGHKDRKTYFLKILEKYLFTPKLQLWKLLGIKKFEDRKNKIVFREKTKARQTNKKQWKWEKILFNFKIKCLNYRDGPRHLPDSSKVFKWMTCQVNGHSVQQEPLQWTE